MVSCFRMCLVIAVVLGASVAGGFDGESTAPANKTPRATGAAPKPAITLEMESAAIAFIREQHPELEQLLGELKQNNTAQYQQAVRDLARAANTLAETEQRDPKKYVLDLKAWQVNSQIQVLAARLAMAATPEVEADLKSKLVEQIDIRLEQQRLDRERTEARLRRLNESIAKLEESREQELVKAFDRLVRAAKPTKKSSKPAVNPKKTAEKTNRDE